MGLFEELRRVVCSLGNKGVGKTPEEDDVEVWLSDLAEIENEVFEGPLPALPKNRAELYEIYGRAPKDKNPAHAKWPKAKMMTAKNLPGTWGRGNGKLYILAFMESYLREALGRCQRLDVLDYIITLGSYSHRHIRHNPANNLSYHSWGAAVDINPAQNRAVTKKKVGQLAPPFSKQYLEQWPNHMPFEIVMAFKSVGFAWGGDWGKDEWVQWVKDEGVGWDADAIKWPKDWKKVSFYDPMHFELTHR